MSEESTSEHDGWDLVFAAKDGDAAKVEAVLAVGVGPNEPDGMGNLALCAASEAGHEAVVGLLLAAGADPNKKDERVTMEGGARPLALAAQEGAEGVDSPRLDSPLREKAA